MKRTVYLGLLAGCLLLLSCRKNSIEDEPLNQWQEDQIFDVTDSLGLYARNYSLDIYARLPNGYNRIASNLLDAATDDAVSSQITSTIENFTNGRITAFNLPDDFWGNAYTAIRKCNIFMSSIDRVPMIAKDEKKYWKAEVRLLRSFFYFELMKRHGGIPLVGNKIFTLEDDLNIPRSSWDACVQYVASECDAVKDSLRTDPVADQDIGRVSRAVAMSLKARVLLYAASPLNNSGNDLSKWQAAAAAAKAVMDLNAFSLAASFPTVFTTRKNTEVIFARQRANTTDVEKNNGPVGYTGNGIGSGFTSPTQELADAFEMKNGLPITDPASGYNPAKPYDNRDPRFAWTIMYNGMKWLGRPVETYEGGRDKPGGVVTQTRTGYYMRKFMADYTNSTAYANQTHNFVIFRYAETLLNFAEAQNEASGPDAQVYAAVESIRKRAGLAPFTLKPGLTKEQMREVIRHERRVELAFEEHRFWDMRRWKIAGKVMNGMLHGMRITLNPDNSFSYQVTEVNKVAFPSKLYLYPIPYAEIIKNDKLEQNDGWESR
ncbi:MAG TPA: RagB/SusD family nutrient uptake outer membrane protein [Chitinophaga sp.]|uniref:RagB/SusD family nutrient uptake outer membrane protein n=1 Tax=Chitinophaga sp. TaxID=1869181 RepID=UPI002C45C36A|nr:RagB/SusD family nutrient uptake outer membrane protein [Chitinophaga sp.]HVI45267.1 RagB/SusD family nutrient uptake outer membrane protein [Chitinophaga sp.]